uniref:Uncharacterized protein n=1 Tax=Setaria italica TaxID=4555 RepID=K3Y2P4_SETIT
MQLYDGAKAKLSPLKCFTATHSILCDRYLANCVHWQVVTFLNFCR